MAARSSIPPRCALVGMLLLAGCAGTVAPRSASMSPSPTSRASESSSPATVVEEPIEVEVSGIHISGTCYGTRPEGAPVVVYSHGIGGDYPDMSLFRTHFVERTMVCGYSRAGVGSSDPPAEEPRPVEHVVVEMRGVLDAAQIAPPFFLVGFSGGGSIVQMFAQAYPDDVVGFVSINPAPSYQRWIEAAEDVWSPEELQANELDFYGGINDEGMDLRGTTSLLTEPLPASMPYAVMFDEDCGGDTSVCDRLLEPLAANTELLAEVGEGGRFVWVRGAGHDIDLTEPQRVRDTLDEIWNDAVRP